MGEGGGVIGSIGGRKGMMATFHPFEKRKAIENSANKIYFFEKKDTTQVLIKRTELARVC